MVPCVLLMGLQLPVLSYYVKVRVCPRGTICLRCVVYVGQWLNNDNKIQSINNKSLTVSDLRIMHLYNCSSVEQVLLDKLTHCSKLKMYPNQSWGSDLHMIYYYKVVIVCLTGKVGGITWTFSDSFHYGIANNQLNTEDAYNYKRNGISMMFYLGKMFIWFKSNKWSCVV